MQRTTIDYGIDLGTSSSTITVLNGTRTDIIRNREGEKYTYSAVWLDQDGVLQIGSKARKMLDADPENAYSEFKLQMGLPTTYEFKHDNRIMTPEELSAEILKSLRNDVKRELGENINSVVITVPADFQLPENASTQQAAHMAGFSNIILIQEPVAAALAYGFRTEDENTLWLIYDFGGGTFDAAIVRLYDGKIMVENHKGDKNLGGKLIDWAIVDEVFLPALSEYSLTNFNRGNPKWNSTFSKLKKYAEKAKIDLSTVQQLKVYLDDLGMDDDGKDIILDCKIHNNELKRVMEPFITSSLNLCHEAILEKGLSTDNIEKIVLVGGQTLSPIFREILYENLGLPLEFGIDPVTAVARGAAIFAASQLKQYQGPRILKKGEYVVKLDYKPVDNDSNPFIYGRVFSSDTNSFAGFTIRFLETKSMWRSSEIDIEVDGVFYTRLYASEGRKNEYIIELFDDEGNILKTTPQKIHYTIATVVKEIIITHSIGVALANNCADMLIEKGQRLPATGLGVYNTVKNLQKGKKEDKIKIPLIEGDNHQKADRNELIGFLELSGNEVGIDLPLGTEVEVRIDINESRLLKATAFIPILDEEFGFRMNYNYLDKKRSIDHKILFKEYQKQLKRLKSLKNSVRLINAPKINELINRIEDEKIITRIDNSFEASNINSDAYYECKRLLMELINIIDEIEDLIEFYEMLNQAEVLISEISEIIDLEGSEIEKEEFKSLKSNIQDALLKDDMEMVIKLLNNLTDLGASILNNMEIFWVTQFQEIKKKTVFANKNESRIKNLIEKGEIAIENKNIEQIKITVLDLLKLLSTEENDDKNKIGSDVLKDNGVF